MRTYAYFSLLLSAILIMAFGSSCRPKISEKNDRVITIYGDIDIPTRIEIVKLLEKKGLTDKHPILFIRRCGRHSYEVGMIGRTVELERDEDQWKIDVSLWSSTTTMTIAPEGGTIMNKEMRHS